MTYFTIEEFEQSEAAEKYGIDNKVREHEIKLNIIHLVEDTLDKIRDMYENPIYISSGYRSFELNKKLGGSRTSQHRKGEAADIVVNEGVEGLRKIVKIIIDNSLPYDQLIFEHSKNGGYWIHISNTRTRVNRHECLIWNGECYTRHSPEEFRAIVCEK